MVKHKTPSVTMDILTTGIVEIRTDAIKSDRSLFSKAAFQTNNVISKFSWSAIHSTATHLSVQIEENAHIELLPAYLECINHSCDPNSFFDISCKHLICIRPIARGDEITFFYPSSEWCMARPFDCSCMSNLCLKRISGAKYLTHYEQKRYKFTEFIQKKLVILL